MKTVGRPKLTIEELERRGSWRAVARKKSERAEAQASKPKPKITPAAPIGNLLDIIQVLPGFDPFAEAGDCVFDEADARRAIEFFHTKLTHVKGEKALQPFELEKWQQAIVANLYGWKRQDGTRRFREAYIEVPRKNGKTAMVAGFALYGLLEDGEPGAEVYSAAADADQARLVFEQASGMVRQCPDLAEKARIFMRAIEVKETSSGYKVISAIAGTKHGFNTHLAIVDELHAQPNRDLVDVLVTSTGARRQPLVVYITTAGFDKHSICYEKHDYAIKVRDGVIQDASFLPVIFAADEDDDWTDPEIWEKANPNLGVSVSLEYLERECKRAQETPSYENTFRRLHLNQWTEQDVRWLQMAVWDSCKCAFTEDRLHSRRAYGALDLSTKMDITAWVLVFPPTDDDPVWRVLPRFWIPQENAMKRERMDRVPYLTWAKQGFINMTDGNVVDYEAVKAQVAEDAKLFRLEEVAYDPWNATQIALQLQDSGATMVEFGQGFKSMSEPTKELEKLLVSKAIAHNGNPVLRWMASNVTVEMDPAGNLKPSKKKSTERIDGIVALIMALGRALVGTDGTSVYDNRGVLML